MPAPTAVKKNMRTYVRAAKSDLTSEQQSASREQLRAKLREDCIVTRYEGGPSRWKYALDIYIETDDKDRTVLTLPMVLAAILCGITVIPSVPRIVKSIEYSMEFPMLSLRTPELEYRDTRVSSSLADALNFAFRQAQEGVYRSVHPTTITTEEVLMELLKTKFNWKSVLLNFQHPNYRDNYGSYKGAFQIHISAGSGKVVLDWRDTSEDRRYRESRPHPWRPTITRLWSSHATGNFAGILQENEKNPHRERNAEDATNYRKAFIEVEEGTRPLLTPVIINSSNWIFKQAEGTGTSSDFELIHAAAAFVCDIVLAEALQTEAREATARAANAHEDARQRQDRQAFYIALENVIMTLANVILPMTPPKTTYEFRSEDLFLAENHGNTQ